MSEPVQQGEFIRAIDGLSEQIVDLKVLTKETLAEAKKTNGRVSGLEQSRETHDLRLRALEGRSEPVTRRDLWLVGGAFAVAAAVVQWLPAMLAAAKVAP